MSFILLLTTVFSVCVLSNENYSIIIGQKETEFENPIYIIDNRMYVPLREFGEKLRIPVSWDSEKNQATFDTFHKKVLYNENFEANGVLENGVIPDKETAKKVAGAILESLLGSPVEFKQNGYEFFLGVSFSEPQNSWLVTQYAKYNGGPFFAGNVSPIINLSKSTGEVLGINLTDSYKEYRKRAEAGLPPR